MKVAHKIIGKASRSVILKTFTLFLVVSSFTIFQSSAQDSIAVAPDSASSAAANDGPSLKNISKNLAESADELERIRREEILSYVYMALGFSVVIGIAWFTTVLAKKRKKKEDEVKALRMHNKPHHHRAHHPRR